MPGTGIVFSERFIDHDTGPHHPERPDRLRAVRDRLESSGLLSEVQLVQPSEVDPELVELVHPAEYVSKLRSACENRSGHVDTPECPVQSHTLEIAMLAAGGVVNGVDAVMEGRLCNVFCAVRPPGHHAERRRAMGFCYLNNIAIAAEHLRTRHKLDRVAIVDFDVHHGNGTQHQFERDSSVLFCSLHQDPRTLFPGTGFDWERGQGEGAGATINVPLLPGSDDDDYQRTFEERILPALEDFKPQFLLVSAGFDAHARDPLANLEATDTGFRWMSDRLVEMARELCEGRLVSTLEGGYDLEALASSVQQHVEALRNDSD